MKEKTNKKILIIIISIFLILFLLSRIYLIGNHFTHYDDLYAPYILKTIYNYDTEKFISQLNKYGILKVPIIGEITKIIAENEYGVKILKYLLGPVAISQTSTYAPLQFYLTGLIINIGGNYNENIFYARLPSFIFSVLSFIAWIKIITKINSKNNEAILIGTGIITTSWMFLIYSSQAENFAAAVFGVLILYNITLDIDGKISNYKQATILGIKISILCLLSYQIIFFIPGFILTYINIKRKKEIKEIKSIILTLFILSLTVIIIYKLFLIKRIEMNPGVHWNAGYEKEFLFDIYQSGQNLIERIKYIINFFATNAVIMLIGILSFTENNKTLNYFYVAINIILIILGINYARTNEKYRHVNIVTIVTIIIWIILIVTRKLTLSPTRHSLVLIVPIVIYASAGASYLIENRIINKKIIQTYSIFLAIAFINYFNDTSEVRKDFFKYYKVNELINEYKIDKILTYDNTMNLEFDDEIKNEFKTKYYNKYPYIMEYTKESEKFKSPERIMVICVSGDLCEKNNLYTDVIEENKEIENENLKYKNIKHIKIVTNVTNCFSNLAGSGKNNIEINIMEKLK